MLRLSSLAVIALAVGFISLSASARGADQGGSPRDVLYFVTGNTIQTYDVDPGSGFAALHGTLKVPALPNSYPVFVPGANDHYIYVISVNGAQGTVMLVYATDSDGSPQNPPVQTTKFETVFWNFVISPNGTLAYAAQALQKSSAGTPAGIRAFALDPKTGILTPFSTLSAITYPPSAGICSPDNPFGAPQFSLSGFNLSGTRLIDDWNCFGYDDAAGYYFTRSVSQQTGALGSPVPTVGTGSSEGEFSTVALTPTSILSFQNFGFEGSDNNLSLYWPNATLDFTCTYTLFDACTYSNSITADRAGKFIFFYTFAGSTKVASLDMENKSIAPVGIPLAGGVTSFSLDDRLVYGSRTLSANEKWIIPVYIFDPGTGLITDNQQSISLPSEYSNLIPALRY